MKRKKKSQIKQTPKAKQPADPKLAAEALLRYRSQPGMKSRRRFVNPSP